MAAARFSWQLRLAWRLHRWFYALSGGRIGTTINGMPVLMLTTRGRRSGDQRTVALQYLSVGSACVVIASFVGEDRQPAWLHNLRADPAATIRRGRREERVRAREADGEERETLWQFLSRSSSRVQGPSTTLTWVITNCWRHWSIATRRPS